LDELARLSPKQAEVVKLRFSAGLSLQEIAELHGHSEKTTQRDWNHAKAWLVDRLQSNR
jgi:RNA polymerase sigma factor (sigma-70 family)